MILGIGVDVLDVARVERELRRDPGFRTEAFSAREIADCDPCRTPARHYAARFAAKEALLKALGAAGSGGAWWREVEVGRGPRGEPVLQLHGRLREIVERRRIRRVFVSLSHIQGLATAAVVLEGDAPGAVTRPREDLSP